MTWPFPSVASRHCKRADLTDAGIRYAASVGVDRDQLLIAGIPVIALSRGIYLLARTQLGESVTLPFSASLVLRDLASVIAFAGCALTISAVVVRTMEKRAFA